MDLHNKYCQINNAKLATKYHISHKVPDCGESMPECAVYGNRDGLTAQTPAPTSHDTYLCAGQAMLLLVGLF